MVLRGEPGIGKTALLEYAIDAAPDLRLLRAAGVESEMELPFAGLHQLCVPLLDRLERLPGPQRDALANAFGLSEGAVPDRFLVGLAVLTLLSDVAEERPVLCAVDDAHWLDHASAQALAFVGRRLLAESVMMLFAARQPTDELRGLPELVVEGLGDADARDLLGSVVPGRLDERLGERIVAETRGNPLALLELPRGLTPAQLAGGFGLPGLSPLVGRIEERFLLRLEALPQDTKRLLLLAAAEPVGDPALLWRAAERLAITGPVLEPAKSAGLIEIAARVRFRHPLVRSAVYWAASPEQRREVHNALADATDAENDPDRRAWHPPAAPVPWRSGRCRLVPGARDRADSRAVAPRATRTGGGADQVRGGLGRRRSRSRRHGRGGRRRRAPTRPCKSAACSDRFYIDRGSHAAPMLLDAARRFEFRSLGMPGALSRTSGSSER